MRCKVSQLRSVIMETMSFSSRDFKVVDGVLWGRLSLFPELNQVGTRIMIDLLPEVVDEINRGLADVNVSEDRRSELFNLLKGQGKTGTITQPHHYPDFTTVAMDSPKIILLAPQEIQCFLTPAPNEGQDWRPDETLPEDYYAL